VVNANQLLEKEHSGVRALLRDDKVNGGLALLQVLILSGHCVIYCK
jgi:hypothetical protein